MRVMPPDQHYFADLAGREACVLQRLATGLDGLLDEILDQRPRTWRAVNFIVRCFGPDWSAVDETAD